MAMEEQEGVEHAAATCEVCGTALSAAEQEAVLESGGPALCSVHAAEDAPAADAETGGAEPSAEPEY